MSNQNDQQKQQTQPPPKVPTCGGCGRPFTSCGCKNNELKK